MNDAHIDERFGKFLRTTRLKKGILVKSFVTLTGFSRYRLRTLESGRTQYGVTTKECRAISDVFGVDYQRLLKLAAGDPRQEGEGPEQKDSDDPDETGQIKEPSKH
jgi:transcriptional regulator with XRE-family HTH domain